MSGGRRAYDVEGELGPNRPGSITIDQLLALNDEIAALARAGCRWSAGLPSPARDLRGRLGRIASGPASARAAARACPRRSEAEGRSDSAALPRGRGGGARSGRTADRARGHGAIRARLRRGPRRDRAALWYPLLVLALAYALFVGLVSLAVPRFVAAFESLGLAVPAPLRLLSRAGETAPYWWPVGPILLVVLLIAWVRSGTAARFQAGSWTGCGSFPG